MIAKWHQQSEKRGRTQAGPARANMTPRGGLDGTPGLVHSRIVRFVFGDLPTGY